MPVAGHVDVVGGIAGETSVRLAEPIADRTVAIAPEDVRATVSVEVAGGGDLPAVWNHDVVGRIAHQAAVGLTVPLSLRHNTSPRPSPLKSPEPTTRQLLGTPFMS